MLPRYGACLQSDDAVALLMESISPVTGSLSLLHSDKHQQAERALEPQHVQRMQPLMPPGCRVPTRARLLACAWEVRLRPHCSPHGGCCIGSFLVWDIVACPKQNPGSGLWIWGCGLLSETRTISLGSCRRRRRWTLDLGGVGGLVVVVLSWPPFADALFLSDDNRWPLDVYFPVFISPGLRRFDFGAPAISSLSTPTGNILKSRRVMTLAAVT